MKIHQHLLLLAFTLLTAARAQAGAATVTTLPATGASNTVATLNGTVNPNGDSTTVWFEWGPAAANNYSQQTPPVAVGNDSVLLTVSNNLTGLVPGVVYHGRVAASNAISVVRGNDVWFGSPAIVLHGTALLTNECHSPYTDLATASFGLLAMGAGEYHSVALNSAGKVAVWGDNTYGQTNLPAGLSNVVTLAGGGYHTLALKRDGTVAAWGDNFYGQRSIPVGLSNVVALAGGDFHSLALKSDGTVAAWGFGDDGETTIPPRLEQRGRHCWRRLSQSGAQERRHRRRVGQE